MGTISAISQCPGGGHVFVELTFDDQSKQVFTYLADEIMGEIRPRTREDRVREWVMQLARQAIKAGATTRVQIRTALLGTEFAE
jgi:hypothetical protein